jgi:hypothetical protein
MKNVFVFQFGSDEIKEKFKIKCRINGKTMHGQLDYMINEFLRSEAEKEKQATINNEAERIEKEKQDKINERQAIIDNFRLYSDNQRADYKIKYNLDDNGQPV